MHAQHGTCPALRRLSARFHVDLHPSKSDNILEGVREQLNGQVLRYSESFEGVVMAYDDLNVLTKNPIIHPFFPYLSVDVSAEVLLFKPMPGQSLVGKVNRVSADLISLLVLEVFNASVGAEHIRKEFKCNAGASAWVSRKRDKTSSIEVGSDVRFKVVSTKHVGRFFGIEGSISDSATTGVIPCTAHTELDATTPPPTSMPQAEAAAEQTAQGPSAKKSKKRKQLEAAQSLTDAAAGEENIGGGGGAAGRSSSRPAATATQANGHTHENGASKHSSHPPAVAASHSVKQKTKHKVKVSAVEQTAAAEAAAVAAALGGSSGSGAPGGGGSSHLPTADAQKVKKHKKQKLSSAGGVEASMPDASVAAPTAAVVKVKKEPQRGVGEGQGNRCPYAGCESRARWRVAESQEGEKGEAQAH
ncbi:MAG: hypothetical protein WDW38_006881 [Sanguina aurantia]